MPATLKDLTLKYVLDILWDEVDLGDETRELLVRIILEDPFFADKVSHLRALARDAGEYNLNDGTRLYYGYRYNEEFDRLLESDDWQHPSEVLTDTDFNDTGRLMMIAEARCQRTGDARLQAIRDKLRRAYASEAGLAPMPIGKMEAEAEAQTPPEEQQPQVSSDS